MFISFEGKKCTASRPLSSSSLGTSRMDDIELIGWADNEGEDGIVKIVHINMRRCLRCESGVAQVSWLRKDSSDFRRKVREMFKGVEGRRQRMVMIVLLLILKDVVVNLARP